MVVIAVLIGAVCVICQSSEEVPFPQQYRKWWHVKTTVIGPQNTNFKRNGGIHHFYANEIAMEGYRTGKFPEGSVLVDDLLEAKDADGVTIEGARVRVAVMMKQSARYFETGGWGFEVFRGDNETDGSLTAQEKAACFACHRKGRDSVFSEYRK
jgi:hypothetical protein